MVWISVSPGGLEITIEFKTGTVDLSRTRSAGDKIPVLARKYWISLLQLETGIVRNSERSAMF